VKTRLLTALTLALCALPIVFSAPPSAAKEGKWISIFDGKSLKGWHVSAQTGHSGASKNTTGGKWVVKNRAIVGTQDIPGNGGIVITDKQYGNFDVKLEMNNDYVIDSGLFLRSNEKGQCYQAMIDYHDNGNLMGVYGEGIGGFVARNFITGKTPDQIRTVVEGPYPNPFTPETWKQVWHHGQWNELRARIVGNPPNIKTWINGVQVMDWTDTQKRLPDTGGIALQVHAGGDMTKSFVRYRKIRVMELP
jgi:hypothetical protein